MHALKFLVLALVVGFASVAGAQPVRPSGAIITVSIAAAAGDTSGAELEVSSSGNGIILHYITVDVAQAYAVTISSTTFFDTSIAVITPTFKFGRATLTTIVREGIDGAGAVPADGDFFLNGTGSSTGTSFTGSFPVVILPGQFVTVRRTVVNTAADVTFGFVEIQ